MTNKKLFSLVLFIFSVGLTLPTFIGCDNGTTSSITNNGQFEGRWIDSNGNYYDFRGQNFIFNGDLFFPGSITGGTFTYDNTSIKFSLIGVDQRYTDKYEFVNNGNELHLTGVPELNANNYNFSPRIYSKIKDSPNIPTYKPVVPEGWIAENGTVPRLDSNGISIGNIEGLKYMAKHVSTGFPEFGPDQAPDIYVYLLSLSSLDKALDILYKPTADSPFPFRVPGYGISVFNDEKDVWGTMLGEEGHSLIEDNEYFMYFVYSWECHGLVCANLITNLCGDIYEIGFYF